eukprot:COSAG02_NODE_1563_length_11913_cov_6.216438_7_plen_859_part_00
MLFQRSNVPLVAFRGARTAAGRLAASNDHGAEQFLGRFGASAVFWGGLGGGAMAVGTHGWARVARDQQGKPATVEKPVDAGFFGLVGSAAGRVGARPRRSSGVSALRNAPPPGAGWPANGVGRGVSGVRQAARGELRGLSGMAATMPPSGTRSTSGAFAQPILSDASAKDRRSSTAAATMLRHRSQVKATAGAPVELRARKVNGRHFAPDSSQVQKLPPPIQSTKLGKPQPEPEPEPQMAPAMETPAEENVQRNPGQDFQPKLQSELAHPEKPLRPSTQLRSSDESHHNLVDRNLSPGDEDESNPADSAPSSPRSTATSTSELLSAQTRADLFGSTVHKQRKNRRNRTRDRIQTQLEVVTTVEGVLTSTHNVQVELTRGEAASEDGEPSTNVTVEVSAEDSTPAIPLHSYKGPISGVLKLGGGASVDFHAGESRSSKLAGEQQKLEERNFLVNPYEYSGCTTRQCMERQRVTLVDLAKETAAEVRMGEGWDAKLTVVLRKATEIELTRQDGTEALLKAEKGTKYSALNAAIIRAKASHVEAGLIARSTKRLSTLEVAKPCDSFTLKKTLKWKNVTEGSGDSIIEQCNLEGCQVGASRDGELCDIEPGAVQEALCECSLAPQDGSIELDKWLFKQLSESILLGEKENALYRSGKHVIFSNPNRNQAPGSLCNYLMRLGKPEAAAAVMSLIDHTEKKYSKHVSAVQINVHLDGKSCHKQHHDIYSISQREGAGRDCTCSFNEMVGTACYTVGSSRRVMMRAAPCKHRKKCCKDCAGYSKKQWLHSGDIMYFNKPWNRTWTHGIPHHDYDADGDIGPRMSIALLCAEGDFKVPFVESAFKIPGVGLVLNGGSGGGQCALKV